MSRWPYKILFLASGAVLLAVPGCLLPLLPLVPLGSRLAGNALIDLLLGLQP